MTPEKLDRIPKLRHKILDKNLRQLEEEGLFVFPSLLSDAEDVTWKQAVIQSTKESYQTGNIVGFMGYQKERLVIRSRFSSNDTDYFFQYLLEKVLDIPNIVNFNTNADEETKAFRLMVFVFPYYLKQALRKGLYKTYVHRKYNDINVKGSVDIASHLKTNVPLTGNIAYKTREMTFDNSLMQLIRHTIEFINNLSYGRPILGVVKKEVQQILSSTDSYHYFERRAIISENIKKPLRHAYYTEYRQIQRLCLMILLHQKHGIGSGKQQIQGILFDSAWLWEEYINLIVSDTFYHPLNKAGKGGQRLFSSDKNKIGLIYPDFISKDTKSRVIADAKYKPIENIGNKDYLQVLAYMFRFDAKRAYYFYPEAGSNSDFPLLMNQGTTFERNVRPREDVSITKLGFLIPREALTYEQFKTKMKISEKDFQNRLLMP